MQKFVIINKVIRSRSIFTKLSRVVVDSEEREIYFTEVNILFRLFTSMRQC